MSMPERAVLAHLAANPEGVFPRELLKFADGPWLDKLRGDGLIEMRHAYHGDTHLDGELRWKSIASAASGGWLGVKVHLTDEGRALA